MARGRRSVNRISGARMVQLALRRSADGSVLRGDTARLASFALVSLARSTNRSNAGTGSSLDLLNIGAGPATGRTTAHKSEHQLAVNMVACFGGDVRSSRCDAPAGSVAGTAPGYRALQTGPRLSQRMGLQRGRYRQRQSCMGARNGPAAQPGIDELFQKSEYLVVGGGRDAPATVSVSRCSEVNDGRSPKQL